MPEDVFTKLKERQVGCAIVTAYQVQLENGRQVTLSAITFMQEKMNPDTIVAKIEVYVYTYYQLEDGSYGSMKHFEEWMKKAKGIELNHCHSNKRWHEVMARTKFYWLKRYWSLK